MVCPGRILWLRCRLTPIKARGAILVTLMAGFVLGIPATLALTDIAKKELISTVSLVSYGCTSLLRT